MFKQEDFLAKGKVKEKIKANMVTLANKAPQNKKVLWYSNEAINVMLNEDDTTKWTSCIEKLCYDYFTEDYDDHDLDYLISESYYDSYIERNGLTDISFNNAGPTTLRDIDLNLLNRTSAEAFGDLRFSGIKSIPVQVRYKIEQAMAETIDKGRFCMRAHTQSDTFKDIINNGFKNQFQSRRSSGYFDTRTRKAVTEKMFGCLGYLGADEYEKYGYLSTTDDFRNEREEELYTYGMARVVFKKEKMLNRTTLTVGDSMANLYDVVASKVTAPKVESIPGVINKNISWVAMAYSLEGFDVRDLFNKSKNHLQLYENPKNNAEKWINEVYSLQGKNVEYGVCRDDLQADQDVAYIELQYHGPLTIDDVELIEIDGGEYNKLPDQVVKKPREHRRFGETPEKPKDEKLSDEIIEELKRRGIPVNFL